MNTLFTCLSAALLASACSASAPAGAGFAPASVVPSPDLPAAAQIAQSPPPLETPSAGRSADAARGADRAIDCSIRTRPAPNGVELSGVVHAHQRATGDYSMTITKSGATGSSDIRQDGPFDVRSGQDVLGVSEISLELGARLHAVLVLRSDGHTICRTEFRK